MPTAPVGARCSRLLLPTAACTALPCPICVAPLQYDRNNKGGLSWDDIQTMVLGVSRQAGGESREGHGKPKSVWQNKAPGAARGRAFSLEGARLVGIQKLSRFFMDRLAMCAL